MQMQQFTKLLGQQSPVLNATVLSFDDLWNEAERYGEIEGGHASFSQGYSFRIAFSVGNSRTYCYGKGSSKNAAMIAAITEARARGATPH